MQVKFNNKGTTLIINLSGELDHHYAALIGQKIDGEIVKATTKNLVFDLSALDFMDSSGIGVIAGRYRMISKLNGRAVIVSSNCQINRILEMSGMFKIMPLFGNVDDAVQSLRVS